MYKLFKTALSQYGTMELSGDAHNPVILNYFEETGHNWVMDDETGWCSAFINWCAKNSGYEFTGKLNARSWLEIGWKIESPKIGDLVILWRESPNSWKGHIGLFVRETEYNIYVLGGNQSNMVKISPYGKSRLLEYRRLRSM